MRANHFLGAAMVLTAAVMLAPSAQAAGQWYTRVDLSYNHVADNTWTTPSGHVNTTSKNGLGMDLAFGNDLGRVWAGGGVRGELELTAKYNNVDTMSWGRQFTGVTGHTRVVALMYNLYNDFLPNSRFDPYIGAGMGYANVRFGNFYAYDATTNTQYALNSSDNVFAYQAFLGFKLNFNQSLALDAAYNWFMLSNATLAQGTGQTKTTYHTSSFTLGLDWTF